MSNKMLRIILLGIVVAGIGLAILYREQFSAEILEQWVREAGAAGPVLFMLIYSIGTVLFLPGSVLTLVGGALFGPYWGTFYNLTGATIGAVMAFLLARYLASQWVEQKAGGKLKQLKQGVEGEGWRFVAFVRLVPLFPFNLLNYALGLTRIRFSHYLIATYTCMLPGAIAYTYLGYAGREALAGGEGIIQKSLLALSLLVTVAFVPRFISRLRRRPMTSVEALKQSLDRQEEMIILDVRTAEEYAGELGHIRGARHLPVEELVRRVEELREYLESRIYIVCRTDNRSRKAEAILLRNGYADVHVVQGGMTDWNARAYPVEH